MRNTAFFWATWTGFMLVSAGLIGCSTATYQPLERLRSEYIETRSNHEVAENAPVALHEAERALARAEKEWMNTGNKREVDHLAYIADQKLEIARVRTQEQLAEKKIKQLSEERDRILLEARKREAERAQEQAAAQARAAQAAMSEAAKAKAEAEQQRQAALAHERQVEAAQKKATEAQMRAEGMAAQAKKLEQQLSQLQAKVQETPRGMVLTLGDVLFEFDKADIKPGAIRNLHPLVEFLEQDDRRKVIIEGHTDSVGSESYNLDLSKRRAAAVRNFLITNGIDPERITARGLGEDYPVASNATPAGRQQNRRVEIEILNPQAEARR